MLKPMVSTLNAERSMLCLTLNGVHVVMSTIGLVDGGAKETPGADGDVNVIIIVQ
jgi:hypothetical protein